MAVQRTEYFAPVDGLRAIAVLYSSFAKLIRSL